MIFLRILFQCLNLFLCIKTSYTQKNPKKSKNEKSEEIQ